MRVIKIDWARLHSILDVLSSATTPCQRKLYQKTQTSTTKRTNERKKKKKTPLLCILHGRHWHFLPLLELTDEWLGKTVHGFNGIICAMAFILYVIKFQQTNEKSVWKTMQQWHEEDVEKMAMTSERASDPREGEWMWHDGSFWFVKWPVH